MWIDEKKTLWEDRNRDTWQLPMFSNDGQYCGNVVSQIVEPHEYMVRYFVVFSPDQQKQFLVPSDTVKSMEREVYCGIHSDDLQKLPAFAPKISRKIERDVYRVVEQKPYWEQ